MKKVKLLRLLAVAALLLTVTSCDTDDDDDVVSNQFKVTIQNVFEAKSYLNTGSTGFIEPGKSESFSFNAGKGHRLSWASMFVQSNDLFYATEDNGIALYNDQGNAITGDITSMFYLWDAGTEVNEEPGTGPNQAPRQSTSNTGMVENGTVKLVNDNYTYPMIPEALKVELANNGGSMFTVTVTNVSNMGPLATPFAPGVWVINTMDQKPLFTKNMAASNGLERLAEDGNVEILKDELILMSGYFSPFAPGAYTVDESNMIFTVGHTAGMDLEKLAEDGDASGFTNIFNTPDGATEAGPLLPNSSYSFTFTAKEGEKLSFAAMLVQSNDWFIGVDGIDLYMNGTSLSGDITSKVKLYDAGTEFDEYAGAGNNQPLRQPGANTGADENGNVSLETNAGAHVPMAVKMIKVMISPM